MFAWTLLACVLLCGVMAGPYYAGRIYTSDDLWAFHYPWRHFYAQCLAGGEAFDWMPNLYGGFYLSGEGQAGTYHPLHWLLYKFLTLRAAFNLELLASYPLMLAGMYCFLRRNVLRRDAALLGAMVFTFSGFNLLHFVHPNAIAVTAHIPWLLLAIDVMLRDRVLEGSGRRAVMAQAAVALLTASQLLLGYPQYVWFSLLAEGAYALWLWRMVGARNRSATTELVSVEPCSRPDGATPRTTSPPRGELRGDEEKDQESLLVMNTAPPRQAPRWRTFPAFLNVRGPLIVLAAFKLLGLLIAGVQLLPTIDVLAGSERQLVDADFAHHGALHPLNLLQFVGPYLFPSRVVGGNTHEFGLYIGAIPLVLVAWLVMRWKHLGRNRRFAAAALTFAVLALLLAMGRHGGLYHLQTWLPLVGKFRLPARFLVLVHLGIASLTAVAFADLARYAMRKRDNRNELRPLRRLVVFSLLLALTAGWVWAAHVESLPLRLIGPMLLAIAVWLVWQVRHRPRFALAAIVVFTAADLGAYGFSYAVYPNTFELATATSTIPSRDELPPGTIATELRDPARHHLRVGDQMIVKGWKQIDGYAGLEPARALDYRNVTSLRVAGVRWVWRRESTEEVAGLIPHDEHWLEVPQPLPRARCVTRAIVSNDTRGDIERIPIQSTALVDKPVNITAQHPAGRATIVSDRPGSIAVVTDTRGRQLLVVSERFHRGWKARIAGERQEVVRVNGEFLGVVVEPGSHRVELRFEPASLRYGKWLTAIGLILLGTCTFTRLSRERKRGWARMT